VVEIGKPFHRIRFNNGGDKDKLLEINQWGDIEWSAMDRAFMGCSNVVAEFEDTPNVSAVTTFLRTFNLASNFNANLSDWDIGNATTISNIFNNTTAMSCANYTDTLVAWINQAKDNNKPLNLNATDQFGRTFATARDGGANYDNAGLARTDALETVANGGLEWNITNDTVQTNC
jgi:hypothetical protein